MQASTRSFAEPCGAVIGCGRKSLGDSEPIVPRLRPSMAVPTGSSPRSLAACRDLGEHLSIAMTEQLTSVKAVVGRKRHLIGAVRAAHSEAADRDRAASQGDEPTVAPAAHCRPVEVVVALRASEAFHLVLHHRLENPHTRADTEAESPSSSSAARSPSATLTVSGSASAASAAPRPILLRLLRRRAPKVPARRVEVWESATLVVPFPIRCPNWTPDTYRLVGIRRETTTQPPPSAKQPRFRATLAIGLQSRSPWYPARAF